MSKWCWLLISAFASFSGALAGAAWCAPPARVDLAYETSRNGLVLAEVLYQLEHDGRSYRITETSRGRGVLALRGTARRTSRGIVSPEGLKLVRKGKRIGQEVTWKELLGGQAALAGALNASLEQPQE